MNYKLFIILPLVFLAGLVDSVAGGGGLISLPAYLIAGLPPQIALANNKMSSTFGTLFTTIRYFRSGMIDVRVAVISAGCALLGSFAGARVVLLIDPYFLNYLLLVLLPLIMVVVLYKKELGSYDTSQDIVAYVKYLYAVGTGLVIGFYDGFFGPGTGTFLILIFVSLFKYDFRMANGNTKAVNLASNIAALTVFIISGNVWFWVGIPAACAGIAGNYVGSGLVIKKGNRLIRWVFVGVFVLLIVKVAYEIIDN